MAFDRSFFGCLGRGGEEEPEEEEQTESPQRRGGGGGPAVNLGSLSLEDLSRALAKTHLHAFTLDELKAVTKNFSTINFLREGRLGPVYKGFVDGGELRRPGLEAQHVAVRYLYSDDVQEEHREWLAEVVYLGTLIHPHLVNLVGFCDEDEHRMLVYEYMPGGSLETHLFKRDALAPSLPWLTRLKIAVGAAKGLCFLHEADTPVIYGEFKTSNILVDSDYTAKLSNFGLEKEGQQVGSPHPGYRAPETFELTEATAKSNVYNFGVVLLELLTGRRSVDEWRGGPERNLVFWAWPHLGRGDKLHHIMDRSLERRYSTRAAHKVAQVAHRCLQHMPKSRPCMRDVVDALEPLLVLDDDVLPPPMVDDSEGAGCSSAAAADNTGGGDDNEPTQGN
ncbi:hypothetical protein GUJ93_ZPchr0012g18843 [Zizania palustris]|uniref:Protein kinase domain-containing protein n=1 Tax=Zizania palustris TaxID=103762 RepID=A0A8J5WRD8_ZIZPA|nr:hypothetical protein GUJ93_ZPchr0012g18843 [Zizania palustris]KAG8092764.1 hypothetical protein GUJ93_ZPchr0012g18843 [Zizania palustris]